MELSSPPLLFFFFFFFLAGGGGGGVWMGVGWGASSSICMRRSVNRPTGSPADITSSLVVRKDTEIGRTAILPFSNSAC